MPGILAALALLAFATAGCASRAPIIDHDTAAWNAAATTIEYPDLEPGHDPAPVVLPDPISLESTEAPETWELSLREAVELGLSNSRVLRDLGGAVLQAPGTLNTVYGPSIQESDPRFGAEAALSAFDTSFAVRNFFENNDRALNNSFFGGGTRLLKQDFMDYSLELAKTTGVGGDLVLRHNMDYDANNAPGNIFPSAWNTNFEGEFRQPLLQGAGVAFNRIAGPNALPGQLRGVLLARTSQDISLSDFEIGVRNLVSDIENAYWELYYAYRDLDGKIAARQRALETWRTINGWKRRGREGGEADKEAQAREQYYRLEEDVQNALAGRLIEPTRNNIFRGNGGVHANERKLRQLLGIPVNDGRLIRPADEPLMTRVRFNWEDILVEAQLRRPELRRQKWVIKRRELELQASKNFLLPRLDAVGRYRFRGFGKDLIDPNGNHRPRFNDAFSDLTTGDFQEWQLGFELTVPIGYRQAHAAVRNAELQLARESAVLDEQQRAVAHDLSAAVSEMQRAYLVARTGFNRRAAAREQLYALATMVEDADPNQLARLIDQLLEAQRRLADAESRYFRAISEYTLAVKNVHFHKGSLLDYNDIHLAEGDWPGKAYADAAQRDRLRHNALPFMQRLASRRAQPQISQGPYMQQMLPGPQDVEVPPADQPTAPAVPFNPNSAQDGPNGQSSQAGQPLFSGQPAPTLRPDQTSP